MAISGSNLTSGKNVAGVSNASTASITPGANNLILIAVTTRETASSTVTTPTITGNGLTWVQVNTIQWDNTSPSFKRTTLFRAMGSAPSTGAITIDFAGQVQSDIAWWVDQFSNVDTSGTNGSGAVVQSATNSNQTPNEATHLIVTLGAFSNSRNATYGILCREDETNADTIGSGFTQLAQVLNGTGNGDGISEWRADNSTTVDVTFGNLVQNGGIAIEIKAVRNSNFFMFMPNP